MDEAAGPECGICLRPLTNSDPGWPGCNHPFHDVCIQAWRAARPGTARCPMCRVIWDWTYAAPPGGYPDGSRLSWILVPAILAAAGVLSDGARTEWGFHEHWGGPWSILVAELSAAGPPARSRPGPVPLMTHR